MLKQQPYYNVISNLVDSTIGKARCLTTIDGIQTEKLIGDTWNGEEPCEKYICESAPNNTVQQRLVREYCFLKCNNVSLFTAHIWPIAFSCEFFSSDMNYNI